MTAVIAGSRVTEIRFRAMSTTAHVVVVGAGPELAEQAERRIGELESRWSRFIDTSEITALNAGGPQHVSRDTWRLITCSIVGWERTAGRFDPTVHDAMIAAGYRSQRNDQKGDESLSLVQEGPTPGCGFIRTSRATGTIELPAGVRFDPGGIGKGLAADLVTAELIEAGAIGAMVNLGGDLRVRGVSPRGGSWTTDIVEPEVSAEPIARLVLAQGAIATSTTERRRWIDDGLPRHHLIDPTTGQPHDRSIRLASVVTADAWWAEVCAKQLFGVSPSDIDNCLVDADAVVVDAQGETHRSTGFGRFER